MTLVSLIHFVEIWSGRSSMYWSLQTVCLRTITGEDMQRDGEEMVRDIDVLNEEMEPAAVTFVAGG